MIQADYEGDPSAWSIRNDNDTLFFTTAFSKDFNEWRTGEDGKWIYMKTVFKNTFNEWRVTGDGECIVRMSFSDGSEWLFTDTLMGESTMTKLSLAFIPLISYLVKGKG